MEAVYIMYERESIRLQEDVYKIGRTGQEYTNRAKSYPKGSVLKLQKAVENSKLVETRLKVEFIEKFKRRTDLGQEYFEGSYREMEEIFMKVIKDIEDKDKDKLVTKLNVIDMPHNIIRNEWDPNWDIISSIPLHSKQTTKIFQIHKPSQHFQMYQNGDGSKISPGTIQYKVKRADLISFNFKSPVSDQEIWEVEDNTTEHLLRLIPTTTVPSQSEWRLILVIRRNNAHVPGAICLKGVLQNVSKPDEFALLNSLNDIEAECYHKKKLKKKTKGNWTSLGCKMIAPYLFWNTLKHRLLQM